MTKRVTNLADLRVAIGKPRLILVRIYLTPYVVTG